MNDQWYSVRNAESVSSPALLVYPDRVEENITRAVKMVGDVRRLRPHVKTHKLEELVRMHVALSITKFKCATIAEAELTAGAGGRDILLAYQPVGPNMERLVALMHRFSDVRFSAIADDAAIIDTLSERMVAAGLRLDLFLDIDCGMHRTGIPPGRDAVSLYQRISAAEGLHAAGLHTYGGHITGDVNTRYQQAREEFTSVTNLKSELECKGFDVTTIIAGGTPTFPFYASMEQVECSPGTYVFWDFGYAESMPDMPFEIAATLMTRVISKPGNNRLCLDLGHKAVASESSHPRVKLFGLPNATAVTHSEEHLVIETPLAAAFKVGDLIYGVPRHICPTVALHDSVVIVRKGRAEERWKVRGRDRALTI